MPLQRALLLDRLNRIVRSGVAEPAGEAAQEHIAIDQRLARIAVRSLAHLPFTPNQVTLTSLVFGLIAAWMFAAGGNWAHAGAGLFVVATWLDHCDGELARLTGRTSRFGHYFDHAAAVVTDSVLFVGIGLGLQDTWLGPYAVYLGIIAAVSVAATFLTRLWVEIRDGRSAIRQGVRWGFEMEDGIYLVAPITWIGGLIPFLIAAAIVAPIFLAWVMYGAFARASKREGPSPSCSA